MSSLHPVDALAACSHDFGSEPAEEKLRLLDEIAESGILPTRRILRLQGTLTFMQAYPDNARVLASVRREIESLRGAVKFRSRGDPLHHSFLNTGLAGSSNAYTFAYAVLQCLVALHPGVVSIDWEAEFDDSRLAQVLTLTLASVEMRGLEDGLVSLEEWLSGCRSRPSETDLEVVLRLIESTSLDARQKHQMFEMCEVPVTYELRHPGTGRAEVSLDVSKVAFQRRPVSRESFPLRPRIQKPLEKVRRLSSQAGRRMIDLALRSLCSRNLEIHPLVNANPGDVTLVSCGRGLQVLLVGMLPGFREAPESLFFFLILKNGIPLAYGPACIFLGCCEMGINLYPEFRGGEIRFIYAQFMRSLHHLAGVHHFFLTAYGMGEGNKEALESGAFWFYRKLGFRATNPEVEALAQREEKIIRARSGYRCSMTTLRELSHTEAAFDLSSGRCRPVDFPRLAMAVTRSITERFDGDRSVACHAAQRGVSRALQIRSRSSWSPQELQALERLAPLLDLIPDLKSWPAADRRSLVSLIRAKGARSELGYARRAGESQRLVEALHDLSAGCS